MSDNSWKAFSQTPEKLLMFDIIFYDEVGKPEVAPPSFAGLVFPINFGKRGCSAFTMIIAMNHFIPPYLAPLYQT
jgi:hypothetical protein